MICKLYSIIYELLIINKLLLKSMNVEKRSTVINTRFVFYNMVPIAQHVIIKCNYMRISVDFIVSGRFRVYIMSVY